MVNTCVLLCVIVVENCLNLKRLDTCVLLCVIVVGNCLNLKMYVKILFTYILHTFICSVYTNIRSIDI